MGWGVFGVIRRPGSPVTQFIIVDHEVAFSSSSYVFMLNTTWSDRSRRKTCENNRLDHKLYVTCKLNLTNLILQPKNVKHYYILFTRSI